MNHLVHASLAIMLIGSIASPRNAQAVGKNISFGIGYGTITRVEFTPADSPDASGPDFTVDQEDWGILVLSMGAGFGPPIVPQVLAEFMVSPKSKRSDVYDLQTSAGSLPVETVTREYGGMLRLRSRLLPRLYVSGGFGLIQNDRTRTLPPRTLLLCEGPSGGSYACGNGGGEPDYLWSYGIDIRVLGDEQDGLTLGVQLYSKDGDLGGSVTPLDPFYTIQVGWIRHTSIPW